MRVKLKDVNKDGGGIKDGVDGAVMSTGVKDRWQTTPARKKLEPKQGL